MKSCHLLGKLTIVGLIAGMFGCSQAPEVTPDPTKDTRCSDHNLGGPTDIVNTPPANSRLIKTSCNPKHGELYCTDYGKLHLMYTRDFGALWDQGLDKLNGKYVDFMSYLDGYNFYVYSPDKIENISGFWSPAEINKTTFYRVKYNTPVDVKKLDGLGDAAYNYIMDLKNNHSDEVKGGINHIGNTIEAYIVFTTDDKKLPSTRLKTGILRISNFVGKGILTIQMWKEK